MLVLERTRLHLASYKYRDVMESLELVLDCVRGTINGMNKNLTSFVRGVLAFSTALHPEFEFQGREEVKQSQHEATEPDIIRQLQ